MLLISIVLGNVLTYLLIKQKKLCTRSGIKALLADLIMEYSCPSVCLGVCLSVCVCVCVVCVYTITQKIMVQST